MRKKKMGRQELRVAYSWKFHGEGVHQHRAPVSSGSGAAQPLRSGSLRGAGVVQRPSISYEPDSPESVLSPWVGL